LSYYTVEVSELGRAHAIVTMRRRGLGPLGTLHIGPLNGPRYRKPSRRRARQVAALL